ncbi:hypothetical protein GNZ12_27670 [Paraburkholderia sp. 1N]|uniref:Uncharacterized protein n=1 Tax=Paraburkholderia solitsugae TaxID=2675748 RepID=A0ABX2BY76_9BURK|nr:hypothetical protein [Paraburkholderia solitsugae]
MVFISSSAKRPETPLLDSPRQASGLFNSRFMYGFFSTAVTYPLMFAISVAMTPWGEIVTAFHWVNNLR